MSKLIQVNPGHRGGRGTYYGPNASGYTDSVLRAGVFTEKEAEQLVFGTPKKLSVIDDPMHREPGAVLDYKWSNVDPELDAYLAGRAGIVPTVPK